MPNLTFSAKLVLKPERVDEFLALITDAATKTLADSEGCKRYDVGKSLTEPNVFYLYEVYTSRAHFDVHVKGESFAAWKAFTETDPFVEPARIDAWSHLE